MSDPRDARARDARATNIKMRRALDREQRSSTCNRLGYSKQRPRAVAKYSLEYFESVEGTHSERQMIRLALAQALPQPKPAGPGGSCPHGYSSPGSFFVPREGAQDAIPCPERDLPARMGALKQLLPAPRKSALICCLRAARRPVRQSESTLSGPC
jgi:hypothetical protein